MVGTVALTRAYSEDLRRSFCLFSYQSTYSGKMVFTTAKKEIGELALIILQLEGSKVR